MGCDIHGMVERVERLQDGTPWGWKNSGDPDIGRNYEVFAALAGVRNSYALTPVAEPKGMPGYEGWQGSDDADGWAKWKHAESPNYEMQSLYERWRHDEHSASWLTLAEMKAYDTTQTIHDPHLIVGRDENGKVNAPCGWTSGEHEGEVGPRRIFVWPDSDETEPTSWDRLVAYMENVRAFHDLKDDDVRFVFFFDN